MLESGCELTSMPHVVGNLLEFLGWVSAQPRTYEEAMQAWRTSCPRLSAREDATCNQLVRTEQGHAATRGQVAVLLTNQGTAVLGSARAAPAAAGSHRGDDVR